MNETNRYYGIARGHFEYNHDFAMSLPIPQRKAYIRELRDSGGRLGHHHAEALLHDYCTEG